LEIRFIKVHHEKRERAPVIVPTKALIYVEVDDDLSHLSYADESYFLQGFSKENKSVVYSFRCTKGECNATIAVSKFCTEGGITLALITQNQHNHQMISEIEYDGMTGRATILRKLEMAIHTIETEHGLDIDLTSAFSTGFDLDWIDEQEQEVQTAAALFNEYLESFDKVLEKSESLEAGGHDVYSICRYIVDELSRWDERIDNTSYLGSRSITHEKRTSIERTRWWLHVLANDQWIQSGVALMEGLSKQLANYFEDGFILLFGKNSEGIKQVVNEVVLFREFPFAHESVDMNIMSWSFAFIKGHYCNKEIYKVDFSPRLNRSSTLIDQDRLSKFNKMFDGLDIKNAQLEKENAELREQLERLSMDTKNAQLEKENAELRKQLEQLKSLKITSESSELPHKRQK